MAQYSRNSSCLGCRTVVTAVAVGCDGVVAGCDGCNCCCWGDGAGQS